MQFTAVLALVAAAAVVSAETNAQRMARGLAPNPPAKRGSPVVAARHSTPSGGPSQCNTGPVYCCNSVQTVKDSHKQQDDQHGLYELLKLFKLDVPVGTSCGMSCNPITGVGTGSNSCQQQPVCCENNDYNGLINIGCSPININL